GPGQARAAPGPRRRRPGTTSSREPLAPRQVGKISLVRSARRALPVLAPRARVGLRRAAMPPRIPAEPRRAARMDEADTSPALRIVVVDDEPAMREVLEARLSTWGHEVRG